MSQSHKAHCHAGGVTAHSNRSATKLQVLHCFDSMIDALHGQPCQPSVAHKWNGDKFPLFVTWKKRHSGVGEWRLRGCIGTFSPKELGEGLREYAVIAAFHDSRFSPIAVSELAHLRCDISLLTQFEKVTGVGAAGLGSNGSSSATGYSSSHLPLHDWTIGHHGITIEFSCPLTARRFNATFLPEVAAEQGWSHAQTLEELIHKSGFRGAVNLALHERISLTRYQSEKESLTFDDYCSLRHQLTGVAHRPHQSQPHAHHLKHKPTANGGAGAGAGAGARSLVHVDSDSDDEEELDEDDGDADDAALSAAELAAAAHHSSKKAKLSAASVSNGTGAVGANGLRK